METITFTIPKERGVLLAIAQYLMSLANSDTVAPPVVPRETPPVEDIHKAAQVAATAAPTPPPTPMEPIQPTPQQVEVTQTAAPSGELDTAGQPWDARIHTQQRTKMKDGTWKLARGVDKNLVVQVRAEHMNVSPTVPTLELTAQDAFGELPEHSGGSAPAAPAPPVATATPTPPPAATTLGLTFQQFMQKLSPRIAVPSIGIAYSKAVNEVVAGYGTTMGELATSKIELLPQLDQELDQLWDRMNNTQG